MNATIDPADLQVFAAVVRAGSFTVAAASLEITRAQASRVVARLEKRLDVRLLQRSTRRLSVTDLGAELHDRALQILAQLEDAELSIARAQREPQGVLRIAATAEFAAMQVNRWVSSYLSRYPRMRVAADYSSCISDLIMEGVDVAIRIGPLDDSDLSARKLGEVNYSLYASPQYLRGRKSPTHPNELTEHDLIGFVTARRPTLKLHRRKETIELKGNFRYTANSYTSVRDIVVDGHGVGVMPDWHAEPLIRTGKLKCVVDDWCLAPAPVHAVFASKRYLAPKVRAFIDVAREHFGGETLA